ncbi:unnamed protein product [Dracunculus medinensis]|uniref:Uncharacterized protein n=1 Tax=Dracunculus medinensis TaxID=318479 RepID=A0A3P7SV47_DRAME|nr:unnamed protein product [Dracunculus medinensis]VDN54379.1 unnamed protein product [Dracunculus medinensis]
MMPVPSTTPRRYEMSPVLEEYIDAGATLPARRAPQAKVAAQQPPASGDGTNIAAVRQNTPTEV